MATVNGMTAEAMQVIADASIVSGEVVVNDLHLTTRGGDIINAGNVRGPTGAAGTNGTNGADGATGPAGPTTMIGDPVQIATSTAALGTSGAIAGLSRTNVPVTIGHTYGIFADVPMDWGSVDVDAEWHFWVRLNGVNLEKFDIIRPIVLGVSLQRAKGVVFWDAPATASTDDFDIFAQEIVDGANITPGGSATSKRKMWIVDYGVVV